MSERVSALELAVGLEQGLYDRVFLEDWVDAEVAACERVEGPLLELTVLRDKSDHDIFEELHALAGAQHSAGAQLAMEAHLVVACLGVMLEAGRISLASAVTRLRILTHETHELTPDECSVVYQLDDGYDLAASETYGTLEQVRADFLEFTARYRHLLVGVR